MMSHRLQCTHHLVNLFFTDPCIEDEVRLNDDVVQVCHGSQWGLVCDHIETWTYRDAAVVCRQIGMAYRGQIVRRVTSVISYF